MPLPPHSGLAVLRTMIVAATVALGTGCFHHAIILLQDARGESAENVRPSTPKLCGNAICDDDRGERCTSCPQDCGRCTVGKPELVAIAPESGPANRWVSVFGTHLGGVQKLWLVSGPGGGTLVKIRRKSTRIELFVPAGSTGGALHLQVRGKRRATKLRYTTTP